MATFNIELWQKLKGDLLDGNVFFEQAPEDTPAPYCVLHVMDSGIDENNKTLCRHVNLASIQITIYGFNGMQIDELLDETNNLIKGYELLPSYRIINATRRLTKNASSFSLEVGAGITRFDFSHENL